MLRISSEDYRRMVDYALDQLPNEACGLVAGRVEGDKKLVERVYLLRNTDESPEHFSMDQQEQLGAVRDMRSRGLVQLGNFHSHPETPARPSEEDKRLAYDPAACYLILSLSDRTAPILKCFHIAGGQVRQEELEVH